MTTETISIIADSSQTVYAALWKTTTRFDFADNVFKAPTADQNLNAVTTGLAGAGAFRVGANILSSLVVGQKIRIAGSTGNDGVYTIRSGSAYSAPNTTVNVAEAVSDATVDGTLNLTATPYVTMTEQALAADHSKYYGTVDLSDIAPGLTLVNGQLVFYAQTGASPDLPADDFLQGQAFEAQLGLLGRRSFAVRCGLAFVTTSGTSLQAHAELLADGQLVPLHDLDPAATCEVDLWTFGPPNAPLISLSTTDMGALNTDHRFAGEYANPNPTADSLHLVTARILLSDPALGDLGVIAGQTELETDTTFYGAP